MNDKEFQLINERDDWHAMYNHVKLENEELKRQIKELKKKIKESNYGNNEKKASEM